MSMDAFPDHHYNFLNEDFDEDIDEDLPPYTEQDSNRYSIYSKLELRGS